MVKKLTFYHCCFCGKGYDTELEAEKCEDRHLMYQRVIKVKYHSSMSYYPNEIEVKFEDGSVREYELMRKRENVY